MQTSVNNGMGLIRLVLPCLLCWEIWKEQDRRLYEEQSFKENNSVSEGGRLESSTSQPVLLNQEHEHSNGACLEHGICSHEVLQDAKDVDSNMVNNKIMKKASFKLSWRCKGENSDQHKHDIVYFERGNITTAERSSKQVFTMLFSCDSFFPLCLIFESFCLSLLLFL